jgi:predicted MFS family arabinose efflux permease
MGYAPYAAGLYTNNRFGTTWLVILGAALCGISAGVFWAAEAAIAIAYPEPWNRGKALGYWLTFRVMGQIIGGAVNLSLNIDRNEAGKVSYTVYIVFIAIQAAGALVALLLNRPKHVQREDGKTVRLTIVENPWFEIKATAKAFLNPRFLLIVLWIGQAVFSEAVYFTYLSRKFFLSLMITPFLFQHGTDLMISVWFSVRARALGSFLGGIVAIIIGNLTGVSRP